MRKKIQQSRAIELQELSIFAAGKDNPSGLICPTRICKIEEITLIHNSYGTESFDGMLVFKSNQWFILCNLDRGNVPGSTRERFTIAHELGHFNIPEHRRLIMAGARSHGSKSGAFDVEGSIEELEADTFAAFLLMPPARFSKRIKKINQPPLQTIQLLRKEFITSLESCAIQSMRHDPRILTIAVWIDTELKWHWISDSAFKNMGFRSFKMTSQDKLLSGCSTIQALKAEPEASSDIIYQTALTASHCFNRVVGGGERDVIIREESLKNGRFGVMTVYSVQ